MTDWVVVIEFSTVASGDGPFELSAVQDLIEQLREWQPTGLFHPDRYAIQLNVSASGADEALHIATSQHDWAAEATSVGGSFTRAEVLTVAEFEEMWHLEASDGNPRPWKKSAALTSIEVYEATRDLLAASTAAEVTDILVHFVLTVGGRVSVGRARHLPGITSIDLADGPGEELQATAESFSVAGLLIERWLPQLVDDARRTLVLLARQD